MLANKLKELRANNNLTQADFAEIFSISKGTIAMWETGKRTPDIEMIKRIADYFHVSVGYLVDQEIGTSKADTISDVYLSFAQDAQDEGIDPDDIRLAIETIKNMRNRRK